MQSKSLLPRLANLSEFGTGGTSLVDDGFMQYQVPSGRRNIGVFAWFGQQGGLDIKGGFTVYPAGNDPYGNDIIGRHAKHMGANVVISLIDVWVMRDTARNVAPALWLPWLPIDHDPVPQRVLDSLQGAHLPITYSKWGHDMLTRAGVRNEYIAHGVEPTIYRVLPRENALNFKRAITGIDNAHLTVMVAANKGFPDRKWFQGQLRAWAAFAKDKPNAYLYIHTEPAQIYGGIDFNWLVNFLGIGDRVRFPDRYDNFIGLPQEYLAMVYNAADVLMSCSMSEGFGIPIVESQACGAPVVVTDFSAMPELVRWGHKVKVADYVLTPMNAFQAWPDVRDMEDKLTHLYVEWEADGGDWAIEKRIAVQNAIHAEYSWDTIVRDQWAPLMTRLADEAPPLDSRFQVQVAGDWRNSGPSTHKDDTTAFVDALNAGIAESKPKLRRRVEPLVAKPVAVAGDDEGTP